MVVKAELPGVTEKDVEVNLAGDVLTIKGEKKAEQEEKNGDSYYMERRFGSFERALRLPDGVDESRITADLKNGVLAVTMPKSAEASKQRKVEIKKAAG